MCYQNELYFCVVFFWPSIFQTNVYNLKIKKGQSDDKEVLLPLSKVGYTT